MTMTLRQPMSLDRFLAWEERQDLRYEFDGFQPVAMTGGTGAHAAIQRNIIVALGTRLRGSPCQPFGSELKILAAGSIRYPDAFVTCTPVPPDSTVVTEPVIVFEVLSRSTTHIDMLVKNAEYRATPSIQRYVILQQTDVGALVFSRKGQDWVAETVMADATLHLPEAGIDIPLAELYLDVALTGSGANEPA